MKRTAYCLLAAALALGFNACEGQKAENLPKHYREDGDSHGKKDEHGKADPHAKPAEGEKKHP